MHCGRHDYFVVSEIKIPHDQDLSLARSLSKDLFIIICGIMVVATNALPWPFLVDKNDKGQQGWH